MRSRRWAGLAVIATACSPDEESEPVSAGAGGSTPEGLVCGVDEVPLADGTCLAVGPLPGACPPGETSIGGACVGAGVVSCGTVLVEDGTGGCTATLPASACPAGQMARLGEASCHAIADCGAAPWGSLPPNAVIHYVDGSFGGSSDGSAAQPWKSIGAAVAAAPAGAAVVVAAGSYAEDVVVGKPLTIWGRCPTLVQVTGGSAAVKVGPGGAGTLVHGLALGGSTGVLITGATDVVVEQSWIHQTTFRGVEVNDTEGLASATLRDSLVEDVLEVGVIDWGSPLAIEGCVLRAAAPSAAFDIGDVLVAIDSNLTGNAAALTVRGTLVEQATDRGINVQGSTLLLEDSVVRDTGTPELRGGTGVVLQPSVFSGGGSTGTLRRVLIERSVGLGLLTQGSTLEAEDVTVRDIEPSPNELDLGAAIMVRDDPASLEPSEADIKSSLVERATTFGVAVLGSNAVLQGVYARAMIEDPRLARLGHGIAPMWSPDNGLGSNVEIRGARVEANVEVGVYVDRSSAHIEDTMVVGTLPNLDGAFGVGLHAASSLEVTILRSLFEDNSTIGVIGNGGTLTLEDSIIRGTRSQSSDGWFGVGVQHQAWSALAERPTLNVLRCLIEDNRDSGLAVLGADGVVASTIVRRTRANDADLFGDGIAALVSDSCSADDCRGALELRRTRVDDSNRVGISAFGSAVHTEEVLLSCNTIHLDGEDSFELVDGGTTICGCETPVPCKVLSTGLEPPAPLGAP